MNLGQLKTAVRRYTKRVDLEDLIPDWIEFATSRIAEQCRLPEMEFRATATANLTYLPLPEDFIEMRHIQVPTDGGRRPIEYRTAEQIDNSDRFSNPSGGIKWYTILDTQLELRPAPDPDSTTEIEMFYFAIPGKLVSETDTNKVLTKYPQLYIYAVMIEAGAFLEHTSDAERYDLMFTDMRDYLNVRASAGRFSGNSLQMRAV